MTLVRLGVQFIWIGVESRRALFEKVQGLDPAAIIGRLRQHGFSVLASTILFLEHHDRSTLWEDVEFTIGLRPDFIQFMELAPFPGTALYERYDDEKKLDFGMPWQEWHGQDRLWFRHSAFTSAESRQILDQAFRMEYERLGPSLLRIAETRLNGLDLITATDDPFLAGRFDDLRRFAVEMKPLLWAFVTLAPNETIRREARRVLDLYAERLGSFTIADRIQMGLVNLSARIASRRYKRGRAIHQPATYLERYRWG